MKYWISVKEWEPQNPAVKWNLRPASDTEIAHYLLGAHPPLKVEKCVSPGHCSIEYCDADEGFTILYAEGDNEKAT